MLPLSAALASREVLQCAMRVVSDKVCDRIMHTWTVVWFGVVNVDAESALVWRWAAIDGSQSSCREKSYEG
jgi:hypothetical protein